MRIAILGAAGGMGQWLVEHFSNKEHSLTLSDPAIEPSPEDHGAHDYSISQNNTEAVKDADLVMVSVPVEQAPKVIREVLPQMKEDAVLCEISSLKNQVTALLSAAPKLGIRPVSIHPMFGPGIEVLRRKIVVIPIINADFEIEFTRRIFPEARIVTADADQHDRTMALAISLPYFMNLLIASILSDEDLELLKNLGGTTFSLQRILLGAIIANSPDLHYSLYSQNAHARSILSSLPSRIQDLLTLMNKVNPEEFKDSYEGVRSRIDTSLSVKQAYSDMYRILEFMERENIQEIGR